MSPLEKRTEETLFGGINVTPLIDVMLVLLIALLIALPVLLNEAARPQC